jgi:S1-C subfamily serine protease
LKTALAAAALVFLCGCNAGAKSVDGDPFPGAFKTIKPSVVLLTMRAPSDDPKLHGKVDDAFGSGFVIASGAWGSEILTAQHVVDQSQNLKATVGERTKVPARVLAADAKEDLALIAVDLPNLVPARLGFSAGVDPGTLVGVAGYPIPDAFQDEGLGIRTSVFSGRLSSVRKDALELDVPVIPGESGGPVFEARSGTVIGIAQSRFDEERAIGFAVPVEDARRFLCSHSKRFSGACAN